MPESGTSLASALFAAVDALIERRTPLPPPGERRRLRAAHGLTPGEVARTLLVPSAAVESWETGRAEPEPPQREAYARLLDRLAELYPARPGTVPTETVTAGRRLVAEAGPRPPAPRGDAKRTDPAPAARGPGCAEPGLCPQHASGTTDHRESAHTEEGPAGHPPAVENAGDRATATEQPSFPGRPLYYALTAHGWQPVPAMSASGGWSPGSPAPAERLACSAPCCPVRH